METIIFKPEFEEKLKKLRIKRKFVKNLKNHCIKYGFSIQTVLEGLNESRDWFHFISLGFIWKDTPEKNKFWHEISLK